MTMTKNKLYHLVLAGILCAIGIVVPIFLLRIVLGPMSFTLASHVAVFLGDVHLSGGCRSGLHRHNHWLSGSYHAGRPARTDPASHIVLRIGAAYLRSNPDIINRPVASIVFNAKLFGLGAEMIIVTRFFISGALFTLSGRKRLCCKRCSAGLVSARSFIPCSTTLFPSWFGSRCTSVPQLRTRRIKLKKNPEISVFLCLFHLAAAPFNDSEAVALKRCECLRLDGLRPVQRLPRHEYAENAVRCRVNVSLAASVYASDWNEIRLYGLSCIFRQPVHDKFVVLARCQADLGQFSRRKSAVSAPATQKPLEKS